MEAPEKRSERLQENSNQNMPEELATPTGSQSRNCRTMLDGSVRKSSSLEAVIPSVEPSDCQKQSRRSPSPAKHSRDNVRNNAASYHFPIIMFNEG